MERLKDKIRRRRKELNLSQRDLAARAGVRYAAISRFETGKGQLYSGTLEKLFKILKMEVKNIILKDLNVE